MVGLTAEEGTGQGTEGKLGAIVVRLGEEGMGEKGGGGREGGGQDITISLSKATSTSSSLTWTNWDCPACDNLHLKPKMHFVEFQNRYGAAVISQQVAAGSTNNSSNFTLGKLTRKLFNREAPLKSEGGISC